MILFVGAVVLAAAAVVVAVAWAGRAAARRRRQMADIEQVLCDNLVGGAFDPATVAHLPDPARRYLRHAIAPGTPLYATVALTQRAEMKVKPDQPHIVLTCAERLTPGVGFIWRARARMGGLPVTITDHYVAGDGAVRVKLAGIAVVINQTGDDVARSSRGRLAAEAVWCPTKLLPGAGVRWEAVDGEQARVIQCIDGQDVAVTLRVDPDGRLRAVTMDRHGDVGRDGWGPTPYGFTVVDERAFGGLTIPTTLIGGWWLGTDRFVEANASRFNVTDAAFA